jgi:hypothetical protein
VPLLEATISSRGSKSLISIEIRSILRHHSQFSHLVVPTAQQPMPVSRIALAVALFLWSSQIAGSQNSELPETGNAMPALPLSPDVGDYFAAEPVSRETMRPLIPGEDEQTAIDALDAGDGSPGAHNVDSALAPADFLDAEGIPALDGEEVSGETIEEESPRRLWRLVPVLALGFVYDDNIFLRNTERAGSGVINFDAGVAFELGDFRERQANYLLFNYLGSAVFYTDYPDLSSYNPRFDLFGQYKMEPLTLQLESVYFYLDGVQRQVGQFTTQMYLSNSLRALYEYSDKTSFDVELNQRANIYPDYISSFFYEVCFGFDYRLAPKLKLGLEGVLGLADADESPSMYYQIANFRLSYEATGKLALRATGGLEFNEYSSGGEPIRLLPVFSLGADYNFLANTVLGVTAYRNIESSPSLAQQDYISTGFEGTLRQGIGRRFALLLSGGYENDTYVPNVRTVRSDRVDNYVFFRPALSYDFLKYLTATVFYEHRSNASTLEVDSWYDNRVGVEISASF